MATVAAPVNAPTVISHSDADFALLAGRAITGLADLVQTPRAWNERLHADLEAGVEFCRTLRIAILPQCTGQSGSGVRRSAIDSQRRTVEMGADEVLRIEEYLKSILGRKSKLKARELLAAIEFFASAATLSHLKSQK